MPPKPRKPPIVPRGSTRQLDTSEDEVELEDEVFEPEDMAPKKSKPEKGKKASKKPLSAAVERRVASFDEGEAGRLTRQQKAHKALWTGPTNSAMRDAFFKRQTELAQKKFGSQQVMLGSETKNLIIGIRTPSLAFEYLIAQDVFPLGLIFHIVAKHGVGKSGFLAEIARWFDMAFGGTNLLENETKWNPEWYRSILGTHVFENRLELYRCKSVEDWQRKLTYALNTTKHALIGTKQEPGPGRRMPILFGIDSIMGKPSEEVTEQIFGEMGAKGVRNMGKARGNAERRFATEALKITDYIKGVAGELESWPFSLVLINHLKIDKDPDTKADIRKTGGGRTVGFQESFELELQKLGGHKFQVQSTEFDGYPVRISCEKNSFGPTHRHIVTRILWWEVEDDAGNVEQKTVWDWDWSTTHLLSSILAGKNGTPRIRKALADMDFHLETVGASEKNVTNTAWSRSVGMRSAKAAVPWNELGAIIRGDEPLMTGLRKALRIVPRPLLAGDYGEQISGAKEDLP